MQHHQAFQHLVGPLYISEQHPWLMHADTADRSHCGTAARGGNSGLIQTIMNPHSGQNYSGTSRRRHEGSKFVIRWALGPVGVAGRPADFVNSILPAAIQSRTGRMPGGIADYAYTRRRVYVCLSSEQLDQKYFIVWKGGGAWFCTTCDISALNCSGRRQRVACPLPVKPCC